MKPILKGLAALFVLTLFPLNAHTEWWDNSPPPLSRKGHPMPARWWDACKEASRTYGSNPFLVAAVADIECNGWKVGRIGRSKYQGPCGFNRQCNIPSDVLYTPEKQIAWACRLLRGGTGRLRTYNETWYENNYIRDVTSLASKMEWQAKQVAFGW